jgi:predicted DNA-binding protein (MmcQ/YjbR family)
MVRAPPRGYAGQVTTSPAQVLRRLRRLCVALPGTVETTSFGHPTFCVGDRIFLVLEPYRGRLCIVFKAEPLQQQALVEADRRYSVAPYIGRHGWVSLVADGELDWHEVRRLVVGSHRLVSTEPGKHRRSQRSRPA